MCKRHLPPNQSLTLTAEAWASQKIEHRGQVRTKLQEEI
jgi:hypothetical protein